jgi:hypothetical protein
MKKWKRNAGIGLIICILTIGACTFPYIKQGNKRIDTLQYSLNDMQMSLQSIDTVQLRQVFKEYSSTVSLLRTVEDYERKDDEWRTINQFGYIRKPLRNLLGMYSELNENVQFSKKQLSDLQHDLKKRVIKKTEFNEYIIEEEKEIFLLKDQIDLMIQNVNSQLIAYDTLRPKILKIVESYK